MNERWPQDRLDPVRRMRVLGQTLHAPMYAEVSLPQPPDEVWAVAGDLEGELPHLIRTMRSFTFVGPPPAGRPPGADGTPAPAQAIAVSRIGHRARFDVQLEPHWCLMQSRHVVGGMAAVPDGDGTRFAVLGSFRAGRSAVGRAALLPGGRWAADRMIRNLVARLQARTPLQEDRRAQA